jgi:hypothetical protein
MRARIYQRPKTATQSGTAGAGNWVLDWQTPHREVNEPLMGWWGSGNTQGQVRLQFDTCEQALAYARENEIDCQIEHAPPKKAMKPKAYADNFRYGRVENWTH